MGQTVNLLALAFGGSNPSLPTFYIWEGSSIPTFIYRERFITAHREKLMERSITTHFFIYRKVHHCTQRKTDGKVHHYPRRSITAHEGSSLPTILLSIHIEKCSTIVEHFFFINLFLSHFRLLACYEMAVAIIDFFGDVTPRPCQRTGCLVGGGMNQ